MFLKSETLIVIGQLMFIVILSLIFSTTSLSPLNNGVEGFHTSTLEYTGVSSPTVPLDNANSVNLFNKDSVECKKVDGFSNHGVFCNPGSPPESIDIFSQAKGEISCDSLGYSNSRGSLCLDEKMKRLLTTRGGNATGSV